MSAARPQLRWEQSEYNPPNPAYSALHLRCSISTNYGLFLRSRDGGHTWTDQRWDHKRTVYLPLPEAKKRAVKKLAASLRQERRIIDKCLEVLKTWEP